MDHFKGCECNLEKLGFHNKFCIFRVFTSCRMPECFKLKRCHFQTPEQLLRHAELEHGVAAKTTPDNNTMDVMIESKFLLPGVKGYSASICKRIIVKVDEIKIVIPVFMVVKQNESETDSNVMIIPIQVQQDENHNNMVHMTCGMTGRDGKIIKPLLTTPPDKEEALVVVSRSQNEFFNKHSSSVPSTKLKFATFSGQDILRDGILDESTGMITVKIKTIPKFFRISKNGDDSFVNFPFAITWSDLDLPPEVKNGMMDGDEQDPWFLTRAVLPPLKGKFNVMIECRYEDFTMNAIMGATLSNITPNFFDRKPINCQVLVIMSSKITVDLALAEFKKRTTALGVKVCRLVDLTRELVSHVQFHGAHIIITTPDALNSLMEDYLVKQENAMLMQVLSAELAQIHLNQPSKYLRYIYRGIMNDFFSACKISIKSVQLTAYDNLLSYRIQNLLQLTFFNGTGNFLSVGPNPRNVIRRWVNFRLCSFYGDCRAKQVGDIIGLDKRGPRKWLIVVNSTNAIYLNFLYETLFFIRQPSEITIVNSLQEAHDNPYLLESFLGKKDGIVIVPYSALDLEDLKFVEGVIVYDKPEDEADLIRIAKLKFLKDKTQLNFPLVVFKIA